MSEDERVLVGTLAIVAVVLTVNGEIGQYLGLLGDGIEAYTEIFF